MPGAFGDAFRALESLPGVTPIVSGLPYYFVRGAPPGNTGFFIDGVRVPGLFHLGVGPAVMYPALHRPRRSLQGAYPVSFGRFAEASSPPRRCGADHARPTGRSVCSTRARSWRRRSASKPTAPHRGERARLRSHGYPGLLLSIFAPNAGLAYWDYQSRVSYEPPDRDVVSVLGFGSYDSVSQRDETDKTRMITSPRSSTSSSTAST